MNKKYGDDYRNGSKGANRQQETTIAGQSEILSLLCGLDLRGCKLTGCLFEMKGTLLQFTARELVLLSL